MYNCKNTKSVNQKNIGLTSDQYQLYDYFLDCKLGYEEQVAFAEISQSLHQSKSSSWASQISGELQSLGLIRKVPHSPLMKVVILAPSPETKQIIPKGLEKKLNKVLVKQQQEFNPNRKCSTTLKNPTYPTKKMDEFYYTPSFWNNKSTETYPNKRKAFIPRRSIPQDLSETNFIDLSKTIKLDFK